MIIVSPDVIRDGSNVPNIDGAIVSPILEAMTGADCLISKLDIPAGKEALLVEHIANGAMGIQLKVDSDGPASVGNRIRRSQAKMSLIFTVQRRWLVQAGVVLCDGEGNSIINGKKVSELTNYGAIGKDYWAWDAALVDWNKRGGCFIQLPRAGMIPEWLKRREKELINGCEPTIYAMPDIPTYEDIIRDNPKLKDLVPQDNDPFQSVQLVRGGLVMLAWLIGPKKASDLWLAANGSFGICIEYLTDMGNDRITVKGIGDGIKAKSKNKLNIEDGYCLRYVREGWAVVPGEDY